MKKYKQVFIDLKYRNNRNIITKLNKKRKQQIYSMRCARDYCKTVHRRMKNWTPSKDLIEIMAIINIISFNLLL